MAVARLSKATVRAPKDELNVMLLKLMDYGQFHPIKNKDFVQDIDLLILGSRAGSSLLESWRSSGERCSKASRCRESAYQRFQGS